MGTPAPINDILGRIASESLAWSIVVVLALVVAALAVRIDRMHKLRHEEDQKAIDRLATVIANNTSSNQLLAEAVRSRRRTSE